MNLLLQTSLYFSLLQSHPAHFYTGDYRKGEIEIILEQDRIQAIENLQQERLLKKGFSAPFALDASRVGVVAEDTYWLWIRDAVQFPGGAFGTYDRLLWRSSLDGPAGVIVLPITQDEKIALNLNFRHATRSWEFELPRETRYKGETPEQTAIRGIREEMGYKTLSQTLLGYTAPDSGVLNTVAPVFLSFVEPQGPIEQDESEAIEGIRLFTLEEIKAGLRKGSIEVKIRGESVVVPIRDSFLTFALFQANNFGLFPK